VKYTGKKKSGVVLTCLTLHCAHNHYIGFDKDNGALLFDLETRKHFHSSNVYFNESFESRHNALHYFDQRRGIALQNEAQPLQLNDFEAAHSSQVRNLYMSPSAIQRATATAAAEKSKRTNRNSRRSSNADIGGDEACSSDEDGNSSSNESEDVQISAVGGFNDSLRPMSLKMSKSVL
jgi:hypothetical protein